MKKLGLLLYLLWSGWLLANEPKMSLSTQLLVNQQTNSAKSQLNRSIGAGERQTVYVSIDSSFDAQSLEALNANIGVQIPDLLTVNLPLRNIPALAELQGVLFVDAGHKVKPVLKDAVVDIDADKVWDNQGLPNSSGYTGNGVIVGIVDNGFDFTHPTFYASDGTLKIKKVWMQSDTRGTPPARYSYGTEYSTDALLALRTSNAQFSHGMHVAGIAAGTGGMLGQYIGIAKDAEFVLVDYKEDGRDPEIADGIKYIFDYAQSVGKPAVVNLSLGHHFGPHDGTSSFDKTLDNLVRRGRIVVGAVGNEGDTKLHAQHTFTAQKEVRVAVPPDDDGNGSFCAKTIPATDFEWSIEVWNRTTLKKVYYTKFYTSAQNQHVQTSASVDRQTIALTAYSYRMGSTVAPSAYLEAVFTNPDPSKFTVTFAFKASSGTLHVWNANPGGGELSRATTNPSDAWLTPDVECTAGEIGGTARRIISVGSYNIHDANGRAYPVASRSVSWFSSHGPTADRRTKPDIIAPGSFVYSSVNSTDINHEENYLHTDIKSEPDGQHSYAMMQGTSMATPMVTGVVALMLEANPVFTPDTILGLLRKYAKMDNAIINKSQNVRGYGKLNALATLSNINDREDLLLSIRAISSQKDAPPPLFTIVPNPNKGAFHLRFDDAQQGEMLVYNLIGTLLQRQTVTSNQALSLQHLPSGIYIIKLQLNEKLSAQKMVIN